MKTALVLGGADCLFEDIAAYSGPVDGCVACNDAGAEWPLELDAWVSFHPQYFATRKWEARRAANGFPPAQKMFGHNEAFRGHRRHTQQIPKHVMETEYRFHPDQKSGSSGLFAAKVALVDLGFDRVVLCGVPLSVRPHFWDAKKEDWRSAIGFRTGWEMTPPEYLARMRSMSGWTRDFLGAPDDAAPVTLTATEQEPTMKIKNTSADDVTIPSGHVFRAGQETPISVETLQRMTNDAYSRAMLRRDVLRVIEDAPAPVEPDFAKMKRSDLVAFLEAAGMTDIEGKYVDELRDMAATVNAMAGD